MRILYKLTSLFTGVILLRQEVVKVKVTDLTVEELKALIKEAVHQEIREILGDPDKGLELSLEMEERLQNSLVSTERISFEEVKKRLGQS
jgi:hypothetical protein